jgi:hypothetical protein
MPTVIIANVHYNFGTDNSRLGGETMDNEIYTEYDLSLIEALKTLQKLGDSFAEAVALSSALELDREIMGNVDAESIKRRDAENVKRLQEISGK